MSSVSFNSLALGVIAVILRVIFESMIRIKFMTTSEIALNWMPQNTFNDKSALVQVMARCLQTTSHCLSQCWPRYKSSYGVNSPEWVNSSCRWIYPEYFTLWLNGIIFFDTEKNVFLNKLTNLHKIFKTAKLCHSCVYFFQYSLLTTFHWLCAIVLDNCVYNLAKFWSRCQFEEWFTLAGSCCCWPWIPTSVLHKP